MRRPTAPRETHSISIVREPLVGQCCCCRASVAHLPSCPHARPSDVAPSVIRFNREASR